MLSFALARPLRLAQRFHLPPSRFPRRDLATCRLPKIRPSPPRPLHQVLRTAPSEPGVYRFLAADHAALYIGKARDLRARLRNYLAPHAAGRVGPRIAAMLADATALDFILTASEAAALALEAALIAEHRPRYNVLLKDDRRHPYAVITFSETYPRIIVSRTRRTRAGDRMYGPFVEEARLRRVLAVIHAVFPLRQRNRPLFTDRPCINYDLGRCPGVCQSLITPEQYAQTIAKVDKLLSGRVHEVLAEMNEEMQRHSNAMEYELAASVRDGINNLESVFYGNSAIDGDFVQDSISAGSIVSQDAFDFRDVFAVAKNADVAKIVLFQMRGGKVISRLVFSVEVHGQSDGELLGAVLSSHYAAASHSMEIPEEVLVCAELPDAEDLQRILSEKRGKRVAVRGTRGSTSLAQIVQRNADMELSVERQRMDDDLKDLELLTKFLRPYCESYDQHAATGHQDDLVESDSKREFKLNRIECFDISHTSGSNAVGSMAVFLNGAPAPAEYRRYNLEEKFSSQGNPDDFESIRETLRRRLRHFSAPGTAVSPEKKQRPDLIVIDGGKGQLSAAVGVLKDMELYTEIPVISIAKGEEEIFVEGLSNAINYDLESDSCTLNDGLRIICRIRDEAHNTAIRAHRRRRGKQALRSGLDSVPGLGAVKRSALLDYFKGSSEAVATASTAQLKKAPGIGPALALRIYEHFHAVQDVKNEARITPE